MFYRCHIFVITIFSCTWKKFNVETPLAIYEHNVFDGILYYQNNKKTFSIKMKEDVEMSKPKKHANKVGKLT